MGAVPVADDERTFKYAGGPGPLVTIRAVGFDLDYTLVVPDRDRSVLLSDAVDAVGAPPISRDAYLDAHRRNLTGETRAPIFEDLLARGGGDTAASSEELARAYREAINAALVPVRGVESMLASLRERYRVGLLTNGPTVAQQAKLVTLGWEDAFDAVVITGELTAGKPDAAAFEALLDALDADPGETAYVGDELDADVAGASASGFAVVQVVFPGGPAPDPRADAQVERDAMARELPAILESL